jgi:choline kinase
MSKQVIILAAGMGTRLARPLPKPLTELRDGRSIMKQQMDNLAQAFGDNFRAMIVVGFKLEAIIERFPEATFVYNELYDQTNTSKSLLKALRASNDGGALWLNGDVVFDPEVLNRVLPLIEADQSFVVVNTAKVSDEEVKYTLSGDGYIDQLSKQVVNGLGEAVGINFVSSKDKQALIKRLAGVDDQDYFERGIEVGIESDGLRFQAVDISDLYAVEVDFAEDLERANEHFKS